MKTCDEMVNSLFQRREQYLAEQKIKRRNAVISTALYCCAFAAVAGIGVWVKGEISGKPVPVDSSVTNPDSSSVNSSVELSNLPIKWAATPGNYGDLIDDMDYDTEWNGKRISGMLCEAIDEGGDNCLYAVEARCFSIDEQSVYNGKTLAQYEAEYGEKSVKLEHSFIVRALLEGADSLKIKNGDKISKEIYDELVSYVGERISKPEIEEIISEYIVDGVFLKDKASQYRSEAQEEWKAAVRAKNQAQKACRADFYKEVGKQLEAKGIENELIYEDTNPEDFLNSGFISDYLLLFISKEDFADLTLDNMSDWIFCHGYNNPNKPDLPVVWCDGIDFRGLGYWEKDTQEWNGKRISNTLYNSLNSTDENCLFAVTIEYFWKEEKALYNGKTIAQYLEDARAIEKKLYKLKRLSYDGDDLKYGDALYQTGTPDGVKWDESHYEDVVSDIGQDIIDKYIVDGVFLKDELLQDIEKTEEDYNAAYQAWEQARIGYPTQLYETLGKQLEAKGIKYIADSDGDFMLMFISKDDLADLTTDDTVFCEFRHASKRNDDLPIVWEEEPKTEGDTISTLDYYVDWNGKELFNTLWSALEEHETDDNCLFAISPHYHHIDYRFEYNGKTLEQYHEEQQGKRCKLLNELLKEGEALKYGEALYQSGTPDGEKWSKELYDSTVAKYGEEFLSQYIVDGVFLKDKVLRDIPETEKEMEVAQKVFEQACAAYRAHVYQETVKQPEFQGIIYELENNSDYLTLYLTKEEFADLNLENMSDWAFFLAPKNIKPGSDTVNE